MSIHKGQIFDVIDSSCDWWLAGLVRDVKLESGRSFCEQGWVPGSFLDGYEGQLGKEEEAAIQAGLYVCEYVFVDVLGMCVSLYVCMRICRIMERVCCIWNAFHFIVRPTLRVTF